MNAPSDWIFLSKVTLALPPFIGEREGERRQAQTFELELGMNLDLDAAASGDLSRSVDYAAIVDQVQFIAQHGRWLLAESMAVAIARLVLAPPSPAEQRAAVHGVLVRLRRTDPLRSRAVPGIELRRDHAWYGARDLTLPQLLPARIEALQETPQTGAYRIHLPAGSRWIVPAKLTVQVIAGAVSLHEDAAGAVPSPERGEARPLRVQDEPAEAVLGPGAVLGGGDREISALEDAPACLLAVCESAPLSKAIAP
jgi:FolB domain-containing protein